MDSPPLTPVSRFALQKPGGVAVQDVLDSPYFPPFMVRVAPRGLA